MANHNPFLPDPDLEAFLRGDLMLTPFGLPIVTKQSQPTELDGASITDLRMVDDTLKENKNDQDEVA